MKKLLLASVLSCFAFGAQAQPALDSGYTCAANVCFSCLGTCGGFVSPGTTMTLAITTAQNDSIVYIAATGGTSVAGGTPPSFTPTGCGVTWQPVRIDQRRNTTDTRTMTLQTFWARAPTPLIACVATVTADRTLDAGTMWYGAVQGVHDPSAPFDTNANIPQLNENLTASSIVMGGTITTTEANDLIIGIATANDSSCSVIPSGSPNASRGTSIGGAKNFGSLVWSCLQVQTWSVTALQAATVWTNQETVDRWLFSIDAMTADAAPSTGRSRIIQ